MINQAQLDSWLKEYQSILRMNDWRISATFVSRSELRKDHSGYSYFDDVSHCARIIVLSPESYEKDYSETEKFISGHDPEQVLVHELLHPKFHMVKNQLHNSFEAAIDSVATAIVLLRRTYDKTQNS